MILRPILFKLETTYGTDATPAAGTNDLLTFDAQIEIIADKLERAIDRAFYGANPFVLVGRRARITFDVELMGAATVGNAAPIGPVLRACGNAQVLTASTRARYNPITSSQSSATIYFAWGDGSAEDLRFVVTGARGTMATTVVSKGYWKGKATFEGTVALPTEAGALTGIVLTGFQDPVPASTEVAELTIAGNSVRGYEFALDFGATVTTNEDFKIRQTKITQRAVTGSLKCVKEAFSVWNPWSDADTHTKRALVCTVDGGAGKKTIISVDRAQFEYPKPAEFNGEPAYEVAFTALPSGSGNDDYLITFE